MKQEIFDSKLSGDDVDNGEFTRSYTKNGEAISENGGWYIDKEGEKWQISGTASIGITTASGTVSSSYYNIIKLDSNELGIILLMEVRNMNFTCKELICIR